MPLYTFRNTETGEVFDRVVPLKDYDVFLAACPFIERVIVPPQIMKAMPEYRSPVDGRIINSRAERRDDLERNNCREWDAADSPTKGKFRNERFARKVGAKVAEEYRDHPVNVEYRETHGARV